jgi:hypothetical protein
MPSSFDANLNNPSDIGLAPDQLDIIHRVLRTVCRDRHIEIGSDRGKDLSLTILSLYRAGARDEERLYAALRASRHS